MRGSSSNTDGGVEGERSDAAAQLAASLREVNQHALRLSIERDNARIQADELGKRLVASQEQIRVLSQQLATAREQVDDSTRRLAVALEQAADSTRRLSAVREEIENLVRPKREVAGASHEGEGSRGGARHWHAKNLVTGRRVGVLIVFAIITFLFVNPIQPTLPSAWGGRASTSQPALAGTVKQNEVHLRLSSVRTATSRQVLSHAETVKRQNFTRASTHPSVHTSKTYRTQPGSTRVSRNRSVSPSSIVCLHGCRADIEIRHGVFVVKTFPNDRAYTKYLRLHHSFVEMVSGLDRRQQKGAHASRVTVGKHAG